MRALAWYCFERISHWVVIDRVIIIWKSIVSHWAGDRWRVLEVYHMTLGGRWSRVLQYHI